MQLLRAKRLYQGAKALPKHGHLCHGSCEWCQGPNLGGPTPHDLSDTRLGLY